MATIVSLTSTEIKNESTSLPVTIKTTVTYEASMTYVHLPSTDGEAVLKIAADLANSMLLLESKDIIQASEAIAVAYRALALPHETTAERTDMIVALIQAQGTLNNTIKYTESYTLEKSLRFTLQRVETKAREVMGEMLGQ